MVKILIQRIVSLKQEIEPIVSQRLNEFAKMRCARPSTLFKELCFCLLTANFQSAKSIVIQKSINNGFLTLSAKQLETQLRRHGYRFPKTRAERIVEARQWIHNLRGLFAFDDFAARGWLARNVKGLGMKESSHYLRNVGFTHVAILDRHVLSLLEEDGIVRPTTLTPKKYVKIESHLANMCTKTKLSQAALDLYLFYMKTGKILK